MEDDAIEDDHVEGIAENAARVRNEMEAGPEDH